MARVGRGAWVVVAAVVAIAASLAVPAGTAPAGAALTVPAPLETGWATRVTGTSPLFPGAVVAEATVLPDGATLVLVAFAGALALNDGTGRAGLDGGAIAQGYALGRLGVDGRPQWLVPVLGTTLRTDPEPAVELVRTTDGRVRVIGSGSLTLATATPITGFGIGVVEIDPVAGTVLGGAFVADVAGWAVAAAPVGDHLVISSEFHAPVSLGAADPRLVLGHAGTSPGSSGSPSAVWLGRFTPDLQATWAVPVGGSATSTGNVWTRDLAVASDGGVHLVAAYDRTVSLPDGTTVTAPLQQTRSLWLRLASDGTGAVPLPVANGVSLDAVVPAGAPGAVVLAGDADGTVTFGSGPGAVTLLGPYRRWVGSFAADGSVRWVRQVAGGGAYATRSTRPAATPAGTLLALHTPVDAVFGGSVAVRHDAPAVVRIADDGTVTALGALPAAARPVGVAPGAGGTDAPIVHGSVAGLARFGARTGAPVVEANPGGFVLGGAVPAAGTGSIRGTVTDGAEPVAGAVVTVVAPPLRPVATVRTAPDGTWSVGALPAGTYRVRVTSAVGARVGRWFPDAADAGSAAGVAVTAGATAVADVVLPAPGSARLLVQVTRTTPAGSATPPVVQLFLPGGFVGSAPVRWYGAEPHERAELARIPAGSYYVRVVDPATGRSAWYGTGTGTSSTPVMLTDGTTTSLTFTL